MPGQDIYDIKSLLIDTRNYFEMELNYIPGPNSYLMCIEMDRAKDVYFKGFYLPRLLINKNLIKYNISLNNIVFPLEYDERIKITYFYKK